MSTSTNDCVIVNGQKFQTPQRINLLQSTPESFPKDGMKQKISNTFVCQQLKNDISVDPSRTGKAQILLKGNFDEETWPQFGSIFSKIAALESRLDEQSQLNISLNQQITRLKTIISDYEVQHQRITKEQKVTEPPSHQCEYRIKQLEDQLQIKQEQLKEEQETVASLQIQNMKKVAQYQSRIKKMYADQKQVNEKMRKANLELQSQKKINMEIKKEMSARIQQLQSDKQNYLQGEVNKLKDIINKSREERQNSLLQEMSDLRRIIFKLEEELRIAQIRISLMERKKQHAVAEAIQRKDQQIKVQKTISKSLHEKVAKLQAEKKNNLKKTTQSPRVNKCMSTGSIRAVEEEVRLSLSPQAISNY